MRIRVVSWIVEELLAWIELSWIALDVSSVLAMPGTEKKERNAMKKKVVAVCATILRSKDEKKAKKLPD